MNKQMKMTTINNQVHYQHTAGQRPEGLYIQQQRINDKIPYEIVQCSADNRGATLVTGLLYIPVLVLTVTTRTIPSFPGWT